MKCLRLRDVILSYKVIGQGPPMLLIHGNGEDHRIFDRTVHVLEKYFTCYLVDSRGHGKSSRVLELHYRQMTEDMLLFMEKLNLRHVTFTGFSDGGIIGLMAASRSRRIDTLIVCGANMRPEGLRPFFNGSICLLNVFRRDPLLKLMLEEPDLTDRELHRIQADTLVIAGQYDLIKRTETEHIAREIPHAAKMILPGETHTSYVVHSEKLGHIILKYIRERHREGQIQRKE